MGCITQKKLCATLLAFIVSAVITLLRALILSRQYPPIELIRTVPLHLWFGGVINAIGVALFYYLIPKRGIGAFMSLALTGQLILAVFSAHLGWFGHPSSSVTPVKVLGILAMLLGITLINR